MSRLSPEIARICFSTFRTWFGPPPAVFEGSTLDGRIRLHTLSELGWPEKTAPRAVQLVSEREAIRWCVTAGHPQRALELCERFGVAVDDLLPVYLTLPVFAVAPLVALVRRPRRSAKKHRRRVWHAKEVRSMAALARAALESNRMLAPHEVLKYCDSFDRQET